MNIGQSERAVEEARISFEEQVTMSLSGQLPFYSALKVCDTPQILLDVGCAQYPMLYTQKHLRDALAEKEPNNIHKHGLTLEQIYKMPQMISEPAVIYDSLSRGDSIVVVTTDYDLDDCPIIASIKPNGTGRYELETITSNYITSYHGRSGFINQLNNAISNDKILYANKEKTQEIFERWGLRLPELTKSLAFDIILHQSRNIVKQDIVYEDDQFRDNDFTKCERRMTMDENFKLNAYVTNLGKYNEGQLVGEWVSFPTTAEHMQGVLNRIGIGKGYEEYFITDYDTDLPNIAKIAGEYESLDKLNYLGVKLQELSSDELDQFKEILESDVGLYEVESVTAYINLTDNLDHYTIYPDVTNEKQLGEYVLYESGAYDVDKLGDLAMYIDCEALGRDTRLNDGGEFTRDSYVINDQSRWDITFDGKLESIPSEYRVTGSGQNQGDQPSNAIEDAINQSDLQAVADEMMMESSVGMEPVQ